MLKIKKLSGCTLILLILLLTGCSSNATPSFTTRGEPDLTTDTWSSTFDNKEDKLDFLEKYITLFSEVQDTEYHIIYHDNSGGMIPGPSDWDIRVALKIAPEDIMLWTDGMKKLISDQIDLDWWGELNSEQFIWKERDRPEFWKRPDSNAYLVVYPENGVLLKIASTTPMLKPPYFTHDNEVLGFDEYKTLVAELLNYDESIIPYIKTQQAETALLASESVSTIIVFEVFNYGGICNTPVIVIDTNGDIICEVLIEESYSSGFSIADVDGGGYAEILMHHCTGGNGGASTYETTIYKLDNDTLLKLFYFPGFDVDDTLSEFDTGFTLTLADGWLHTVENKYTGYSLAFIRTMTEGNPYFDEHGNIKAYAVEHNIDKYLQVDPFFYVFDPVDLDNDGIYEILTAQYTSLWGRSDSVGAAYTILKWNTAQKTMEVVRTGFWPYEDDYDNQDAYYERWQYYADNWYSE